MYYVKERALRLTSDLFALANVKCTDISGLKMKDGQYLHPADVDADTANPWVDLDSTGNRWGGYNHCYWFRVTFSIPAEFAGKTVQLTLKTEHDGWDATNPQFLAFIDGEILQGFDVNHNYALLTDCAEAGKSYTLDIQAYSGRFHRDAMLICQLVQFDPQIFAVAHDVQNLAECYALLDENDIDRAKLAVATTEAVNLLDLRAPYSKEFYESLKRCTAYIEKEVYEKLAGHNDVIATCVGHTHIDVAWKWTVEQTRMKTIRSFATVLKLMEQYPDYKFMSSQPQLYKYVKQRYPEMYEKIKARIAEGRWEAEGGMWLEADCNVTSGESLVRQFLHGKRFFKEEFGVDNKILWLPDVFGYSAALPQICKKSGIDYFMTTKIAWNQFNKLPYDTFWWKGIDATKVFTHLITTTEPSQPEGKFFTTYNGKILPETMKGAWDRYQQKEINNDVMISYGYGDGGGGPTVDMLERGRRLAHGMPGIPKVRFDVSKTYFDELYERLKDNPRTPTWVGELYLEYHRGTYTSMARNKRSNRKCEILWQDVEFLSLLAEKFGLAYPKQEIYDSWETILLNQFHDILPGSSIQDVYDQTLIEYTQLQNRAQELIVNAIETIVDHLGLTERSLVLFNTQSFDRDGLFVVEDASVKGLKDADGAPVETQPTADGKLLAYAKNVPSKGVKALAVTDCATFANPFIISDKAIQTPFYTVEFDEKGQIASLVDLDNSRQVLKPGCKGNVLRAYENKVMKYDNWDIDIFHKEKMWVVDDLESMEWIEKGPIRATLLIKRKFLSSSIEQKIHFYAHSRRIDFETWADWKEIHVLLKAEFPADVNAEQATFDIQFGNLTRTTHQNTSWDVARFEVCAHKWADVSEGGYGVSLLNDCKYGHDFEGSTMRLTLIKSGIDPNPIADQEEHVFTYAILPHAGSWQDAEIHREALALNNPFYGVVAGPSKASEGFGQLLSINAPNVVVETVKKAEDGNDIILRVYEYENKRTNAAIRWNGGFKKVVETDLMENEVEAAAVYGDSFAFTIKPYEIKTFKVIL